MEMASVMESETTFRESETRLLKHLLELRNASYGLAVRILGNFEGAEDIVQQAYLKAIQANRSGFTPQDFRTWFLQVTVNLARDHRKLEARRKKREATVMLSDHASKPDSSHGELVGLLRWALKDLDERYRLPVALCCEQGLTQREAAAVLMMPERTVSKYLAVGLRNLRTALEGKGYLADSAAVLAALGQTAPPLPHTLASSLDAFLSDGGIGAGSKPNPTALKRGLIMKLFFAVLGAGLLAGVAVSSLPAERTEPNAAPETRVVNTQPMPGPPAPIPTKESAPGEAERIQPDKDRVVPLAYVPAGPLHHQDGPAVSAIEHWHAAWVSDSAGNVFSCLPTAQQIMFFSKSESRVYALCTGTPGYRDGLAGLAQIGLSSSDEGWPYFGVDNQDRLIFTDWFSGTIRMVSRRPDGQFEFSTLLGKGKVNPKDLKPGESVPANKVAPVFVRATMTFAPDGSIYLSAYPAGLLKLEDGKLTKLPCERVVNGSRIAVDSKGNVYALLGRYVYVKVEPNGKIIFLGGQRTGGGMTFAPKELPPLLGNKFGIDGPMIQATFYCPGTLGLSGDEQSLFVGGGDEGTLRKVTPIAPDGRVTTLMEDGTWKECAYFGEKGQWGRLPPINHQSGLCIGNGHVYMWQCEYKDAWLNLIEGPKVDLIRKALAMKSGGGK